MTHHALTLCCVMQGARARGLVQEIVPLLGHWNPLAIPLESLKGSTTKIISHIPATQQPQAARS